MIHKESKTENDLFLKMTPEKTKQTRDVKQRKTDVNKTSNGLSVSKKQNISGNTSVKTDIENADKKEFKNSLFLETGADSKKSRFLSEKKYEKENIAVTIGEITAKM